MGERFIAADATKRNALIQEPNIFAEYGNKNVRCVFSLLNRCPRS